MPYYEFDSVNGELFGRISGGYNKPNNFVAILFPLFQYGFLNVTVLSKKVLGLIFLLFTLTLVIITGLRIGLIIFVAIVLLSFLPRTGNKIIVGYYKYFFNFIFGILGLLFFCYLYNKYGFIDELRGRVSMWEAHCYEFIYNFNLLEIITGKGKVLLPQTYSQFKLVGSLEEAHNNSFRILVTFGLLGYFFYCLFIRHLVLQIAALTKDPKIKFIYMSSFVFLVFYSITNEPAFYSSLLWSVFIFNFIDINRYKDELGYTG